MKKDKVNFASIELSAQDARALQMALDECPLPISKRVIKKIDEAFADFWIFDVKCSECGGVYSCRRQYQPTPEELAKGGLCRFCDDVEK